MLWPLLHASMVMSFCYVLDSIKLVLHGHGRGKSLGTYLVLQLRVSGVMSLQHVSICWLCIGIDEARALVLVLCSNSVSPMSSPLLHA